MSTALDRMTAAQGAYVAPILSSGSDLEIRVIVQDGKHRLHLHYNGTQRPNLLLSNKAGFTLECAFAGHQLTVDVPQNSNIWILEIMPGGRQIERARVWIGQLKEPQASSDLEVLAGRGVSAN